MKVATWMSLAILGPGAIAIFVWFLFGVREAFRGENGGENE